MISALAHVALLDLIGKDVEVRRVASCKGGEFAGPCPFCGGRDRFRVWPEHPIGRGRFWCRGCGTQGDAIDYLRQRDGIGFRDACARLRVSCSLPREPTASFSPLGPVPSPPQSHSDGRLLPPPEKWQAQARAFTDECCATLWSNTGQQALGWLRGRGLLDTTIQDAELGFNSGDQRDDARLWGLAADHKPIWLPRGVVIPWRIEDDLWRVNIRRPTGEPKYIGPAGSANGLYGADLLAVQLARPAVLVEGEFDALSMQQEAGDVVTVVATGSTAGARKPRWLALLAQPPTVLISYDTNDAGERAARYWLRMLPNSRRWRPYWEDLNQMVQDGACLRSWLAATLEEKGAAFSGSCLPTG